MGLHELERKELVRTIRKLLDLGNTVIVVEHDEFFIKSADYIVDMGPDAGVFGGEVIFQGTYSEFLRVTESRTAPYLKETKNFITKTTFKKMDTSRMLRLKNAITYNLKNVTRDIPLGMIVGVAGVSGSGKSSLIAETLVPLLKKEMRSRFIALNSDSPEDATASLTGTEELRNCFLVDQKPIGRSVASCPASYLEIIGIILELLVNEQLANVRGYSPGHFSSNSQGGCKKCNGDGVEHYSVGYGNTVTLECEICGGTGFIPEVLEVELQGRNMHQILEMSVSEAIDFFANVTNDITKSKIDKIIHALLALQNVGMAYIKLGQRTSTISGGEAQRIKLAKELGKKRGRDNLYIFDEPTTGLSLADTERLLLLMQNLCDKGNSIIITEHNPAVLSFCDFIMKWDRVVDATAVR